MWGRFSTSGLAGAYVDDLFRAGVEAQMEFRPRRALDPRPFLVGPVGESEKKAAGAASGVHHFIV